MEPWLSPTHPWCISLVVVKYALGRRRRHRNDKNYYAFDTEERALVPNYGSERFPGFVRTDCYGNNARQSWRISASATIFRKGFRPELYCKSGGAWESRLQQQLFVVPRYKPG